MKDSRVVTWPLVVEIAEGTTELSNASSEEGLCREFFI
jgi:hypothetical protein